MIRGYLQRGHKYFSLLSELTTASNCGQSLELTAESLGILLGNLPFKRPVEADQGGDETLCVYMCMCTFYTRRSSDSPNPSENTVKILFHFHERASMLQEALVHLLQSHVRKSVEVDQHFIGFLKAIEPV